ncbi:MAG: hypothetical protein EOP04_25600 [Proteobacteria bacterium]|nr:MAG: hypothetical protein EOP04_25600 [Pseudomonadota bacterium]
MVRFIVDKIFILICCSTVFSQRKEFRRQLFEIDSIVQHIDIDSTLRNFADTSAVAPIDYDHLFKSIEIFNFYVDGSDSLCKVIYSSPFYSHCVFHYRDGKLVKAVVSSFGLKIEQYFYKGLAPVSSRIEQREVDQLGQSVFATLAILNLEFNRRFRLLFAKRSAQHGFGASRGVLASPREVKRVYL